LSAHTWRAVLASVEAANKSHRHNACAEMPGVAQVLTLKGVLQAAAIVACLLASLHLRLGCGARPLAAAHGRRTASEAVHQRQGAPELGSRGRCMDCKFFVAKVPRQLRIVQDEKTAPSFFLVWCGWTFVRPQLWRGVQAAVLVRGRWLQSLRYLEARHLDAMVSFPRRYPCRRRPQRCCACVPAQHCRRLQVCSRRHCRQRRLVTSALASRLPRCGLMASSLSSGNYWLSWTCDRCILELFTVCVSLYRKQLHQGGAVA